MSEKLSYSGHSLGYKKYPQRIKDILCYKLYRYIVNKIIKGNSNNLFVYVVYILAIAYLVFLASSIQPDIFFSGDGGIKFMLVKQLNSGGGFKYLTLPQPQWVQEIWNKGFFPLKKPFFYPSPQGYISSYPPAFQVLSAFFYGKLGYAGLYIIPIVSTFLLWTWVGSLLHKSGLTQNKIALAIFILVFCSPLTIYGVTYWEHMPAVLLLFSGIAFIVNPPGKAWIGAGMGAICGFAVWFRPEALPMDLFYALTIILLDRKQKKSSKRWFLIMLLAIIAAFFAFNKVVYGSFLGVHSYQVFQEHTLLYKILRGFKYGLVLNWMLVRNFPFSLFVLFFLYGWVINRKPLDQVIQNLLIITIAFSTLAPFIFPNIGGGQWGPRYFLPLIPLIIVILGLTVEKWKINFTRLNAIGYYSLITAFIGYSLYLNVFIGGQYELRKRYSDRITPALNFVKQQKEEAIVVNSDFIPMEMGAIFKEKNFFLAENYTDLNNLILLLKQHGQDRFLYISDKSDTPSLPNLLLSSRPGLLKKGIYFFGKYALR
jgi:hypothetical protein